MATSPRHDSSAPGGGGDSHATNQEIYIVLGSLLFIWLIWMRFGEHIRALLFYMRWLELAPFALFSDEAAQLQKLSLAAARAARAVNLSNFIEGLSQTGAYTRFLCLPPLGWVLYKALTRKSFTRRHTMQTLIEQESKLWKEVSPVVKLDLISGDLRKGRWRVSETEREFAANNQLLLPSTSKDTLGTPIPNLNEERTREVLIRQLGPVWQGVEHLPAYAQGVFVALALKIVATEQKDLKQRFALTDRANAYIGRMAEEYAIKNSTSGMDFSWVQKELPALEGSPRLANIVRHHAYVFTVFATLLQVVRRLTGVQAAASFLWLKPVDRTFYYVLNNVGRQDAYHAEACGVMTHWLAEKTYQRALLRPHIDTTLNGLTEALKQFKEDDFENTIYA